MAVVVVHVHLHLAQILMLELANLEVDEHEAAQQTVEEHEVNKVVLLIEGKADLPTHKGKAAPHLEKELLQVVNDGALEVALGIGGPCLKPREL